MKSGRKKFIKLGLMFSIFIFALLIGTNVNAGGNITRGQAATMLVRALYPDMTEIPDNIPFTDVDKNSFYYPYIAIASEKGIISGYGNGLFGIDDPITRAQTAKLIDNAYEVTMGPTQTTIFSDVELNTWYTESIGLLSSNNIISGYPGGLFKPQNNVIRAEFSKMLAGTIKYVENKEEATSITELEDISVKKGSTLTDLTLPQQVTVNYNDGNSKNHTVSWITNNLNLNQVGSYTLIGQVEGVSLPATLTVVVQDYTIQNPDNITAVKGSTLDQLNLPDTVAIKLDDETIESASVSWDTSSFNLNQPGEYILTGQIEGFSSTVTLNVIILDYSIENPENISVIKGTTLDQLNLPDTVTISFDDETSKVANVSWDTSSLNLNQPGEYTLTGQVEGFSSTVTLNVIILDYTVEKLENISVIKGATLDQLDLPDTVTITFDDETSKVANVSWDTSSLNLDQPGKYTLTGQVEGISSTVTLNVVVIDYTIESPESITVFKGSTLDQLNLPDTVTITFDDETSENANVSWNTTGLNLNQAGEYILTGDINGYSTDATITIIVENEFPDDLILNQASYKLKTGKSVQVNPVIIPDNAINKKLNWKSSNDSIATVDQNGLITAVSEGIATITVTTENNLSKSIQVLVDNRPDLYTYFYGSIVINGYIENLSINVLNRDSEEIEIEKIEVYENNKVRTTYTNTNLINSGISTVVDPGQSWGISIRYRLGGINEATSSVKIYVKSNDQTFVYDSNKR